MEKLGYTRDFLVIDPEEELELALDLIRQHKLKIKYKNRLKKRTGVGNGCPRGGEKSFKISGRYL